MSRRSSGLSMDPKQQPGPLGLANMTTAAAHYGIPRQEMLHLARRLGLDPRKQGQANVADFGGRSLPKLQELYVERLPAFRLIDCETVRRDWANLRVRTDVVVDVVIEAAVHNLTVVRGKPLRMQWFLQIVPFDRDVVAPILRALIVQGNADALGRKWQALPPGEREMRRKRKATWDPDTDPRLDRWVAESLNCEPQHLNALYHLGIVDEEPGPFADGKRRAKSPELLDRDVIRETLKSTPPTITAANVGHYRRARTGFDLGAFDHHADSVVKDVLRNYADTTFVPSPSALAMVLNGDPQQFVPHLMDYSREHNKPVRWSRLWAATIVDPSVRDLRDAMHPDVPVTLTAADEVNGSMGQAPNTMLIRKVFGTTDVEDRTRMGIVALEGARMGLPNTSIERALIGLSNILPLFEGMSTSAPNHMDAVLGPYAFMTEAAGIDERRRLNQVASFRIACTISDSWYGRLRPDEKPNAHRFRLAWPTSSATLFDRIDARLSAITADAADDRDDRIADWLADPDRMMTLMMQRADRTFAFHDAVETCIAHADKRLEAGEWNAEGPIHWIHTESFSNIVGGGDKIDQNILFSIETWKSKCARIRDSQSADPWKKITNLMSKGGWRGPHLPRGPLPDPALDENRYVIVVHDIVPTVPGERTSPPLWYTLFKGNVLSSGVRLPPDLADERMKAIRETGMHQLNGRLPSGLYDYRGQEKRTIARQVRLALGEVCIPVHEVTHGTALAMFSASARYDLPERSGELAQTDLEEEKWDSYVDPISGEEYGIFQQVRKMRKEADDFIFSPYTMSVLGRVVQMGSSRLFSGGDWPLIEPSQELRSREMFDPSTYVVTDGRSMIDHGGMATLFYTIAGGIGVLRPHDVKHMLNAIARREGVSSETRRRWNFHRDVRTTEGYGRPSKTERGEDTLLFLRLMQARRVGIMNAGGVASPSSTGRDYSTRRENLSRARALCVDLVTVLERHGELEAALAKREEIKTIDAELTEILKGMN